MTTLFWFVIGYWILSILIGLYAAKNVHNTRDFAIAGRHLPFYMVVTVVFATWFGAEAVLGVPATFLDEGLGGIVADPFGASLCLILFGLFLAVPLYKMNLLTIGDFYKKRYGRTAESMTSLAIVISYLGWVGAQITALGLVFHIVSGGALSEVQGMWISSLTILLYTVFGGMWAVAVTDFLQMIIIVLGMLYIGYEVTGMVGGIDVVVDHAVAAGKFDNFWPGLNAIEMIGFFAALCTMMLGSMPQQDVFQRVTSSKTLFIAKWATVIGGTCYFFFTFIPIFLAYSATMIDPALVAQHMGEEGDPQMILPGFVMTHMPLVVQILFFGALLSAIKSCASATLLAPSVTFTENILRPLRPDISDQQLLKAMRCVTVIFTFLVTLYAVNSEASIFHMVENAYQVTLVSAFVPLVFGVFWRKATNQGALAAIFMGLIVWIPSLAFAPEDAVLPPQLAGLCASFVGMIVGSLMPQFIKHDPKVHDRLLEGKMAEVIPTKE